MIGHNGTNAAGKVIVRIYPRILTDLSKQVREKIIVVCGTNGKTSTNNMIYKVLTDNDKSVVCNNLGANMIEGVIVAFINKCNIWGKLDADFACLEIDEGYAVRVFKYLKPDFVVLTNLFRDQLDRYGEIDITTKMLKNAFDKLSDTTLVLNTDDPLCVQFAYTQKLKSVFYGIEQNLDTEKSESKEGRVCRVCGSDLDYSCVFYSQLGHFSCPSCDFKRPDADFKAENISFNPKLKFTANGTEISVNQRGLYNVYNILATFSAVSLCGIDTENFNRILASYKTQTGRMEEFKFKNKKIVLNLAKNTAGFNQGISAVMLDTKTKDIIIAVNDHISDGTDVSWLWDTDFEKLSRDDTMKIVTSGKRAFDLLLRFKYADIKNVSANQDMKNAISDLLKSDSEVIYILANYTAVFTTQKIIKELLQEENNGN